MGTYKAALIGCGKRGGGNARTMLACDRLDLVALVDPKADSAEELKKTDGLGEARVYADHREMLEKEKPDFCAVCVWTGLHLPIFRDCAQAGVKGVFLEKPMAATWAESREIARIADETGCRLSFSHQRRFNRGNLNARQMIRDGLFGDIVRMDLYSPNGLLDCGTHTIDQAFSFLDDQAGVKWVHGAADVSETSELFGIPDAIMFTGTIMYDNGVLGNIYCRMPDADHWTGVKVWGTKGFMEFDWGGKINKYAVHDRPDFQPPEIEEDSDDPMRLSYEDIIHSLDTGEENQLSYRKALRTTEVIFALFESARDHRRVELPLTGVEGHPLRELLDRRA
jgi:predicted dehydrogenase